MDWIQTLTIIGTLTGIMMYMGNRLHADVDRLDADMKLCMKRLDGHATRIDQLYQMFVDLLKENRKP